MSIQLPIPVRSEGKTYNEATPRRIIASVIADANKAVQRGDTYKAIQVFLGGCLEDIGGVKDRSTILSLTGQMPFKSAWLLVTKIIMDDEGDDGVEGMYPCPRCGDKKICEANEDPDLDTRDFISSLPISYLKDDRDCFEHTMKVPVEIQDVDGGAQEITTLTIGYPTLNNCSVAFQKVGEKDEIRLQLAIYIQALRKVNGDEVDNRFKSSFGMAIFEKMDKADLQAIGAEVDRYGMSTKVKKTCNKCGKEYEANLNTANFFVSALR